MDEAIVRYVDFLRGSPWAAPVFFVSYAAACLAAPVSLFPVIGGVLFGPWAGLALSAGAALTGAGGAFAIARRGGRPPFLKGRLVEGFFQKKWGFWSFLAMRLVGVPPFQVVNYAAGLTGMPWRTFLGATLLGSLPWTTALTVGAHALWGVFVEGGGEEFRRALWDRTRPLFVLGAVLLAATVTAWALRRRALKR